MQNINAGNDLYTHACNLLKTYKSTDELLEAESIFNGILNSEWRKDGYTLPLLFNLASVHMKRGNYALSVMLFEECIKKKPDFIEAYNNIGFAYREEQMRDKAKIYFEKTLELVDKLDEKSHPEKYKEKATYLVNLGALHIANGTPLEAKKIFEESLALDKDDAKAGWNYALCLLESGDYEKGFEWYEKGDRTERTKERHYHTDGTPWWDGTKGKTVVVFGEQGLGDELMFASMLPDLMKDCNVIIDAHPRLADLFRMNFPNVPVYGTRKTNQLAWAKYHKIDAKISIGSLGKFYRKKVSDFPGAPYLSADPSLIEKYRRKLAEMGNKPKIGISWRGGIKSTNKNDRHIPLPLWKEILKLDATFISLQYDKDIGSKVEAFEKENSVCLNHWQSVLDDYDETAGLITNLDLIISVPQSVVHLAGALGVKTWQLTPKRAMWQMGVFNQNMPWYDCIESIWQQEPQAWEPIMAIVKERLCTLLQTTI
jgi:tetratricopeptide (TPR) repeat protein